MKAEMKYVFLLAIAIILFLIGKKVMNVSIQSALKKIYETHKDIIDSQSLGFDIPVSRIVSHIYTESSGNIKALGSSGERGLMQITENALHDVNNKFKYGFTFDEMFDANSNIITGTSYLYMLRNQLGNMNKASQAFNVGAGNVIKNPYSGLNYLAKIQSAENNFIITLT